MVKAFRELGHEVEISALVETDAKLAIESRKSWFSIGATRLTPKWLYECLSLGYNLYGYRRLLQKAKNFKPELIYERYSLNTFCGIWASRKLGVPIILEVNAPLYLEQKALGELVFDRIAAFSERWICSNSTRTITVTGEMKRILEKEDIPGDHIVVMHNGANPDEFHPDVSGLAVRERYRMDGAIVVGFVGWFRKWHALDKLVASMHNGGMFAGQCKLLLVGDGPAYEDVNDYVQKHNLQDSVIFTGPVASKRIPEHIAAMDIAVQPSATEYACPMKIIEYMAMGKCIVAPNQPNIGELLEDGINALLFEAGDMEGLLNALRTVIEDNPKRHTLARNALQTVRERELVWSANARKVLELIQ
jgi:glycosyltransferase involved in cell wall biosynthesis